MCKEAESLFLGCSARMWSCMLVLGYVPNNHFFVAVSPDLQCSTKQCTQQYTYNHNIKDKNKLSLTTHSTCK